MNNFPPQPIATQDWPEELNGIVKDMQGKPINVHKLMANNPSLLKAWWAFRNHSVKGGSLGHRNAELLILRTAVHMQSWYEWGAHVDRAINVGIETREIFGLLELELENFWAQDERALILAADELTSDHQISAQTLSILNTHFTNDQVMDLIAIHGMYLILAAMLKTWGLALDNDTRDRIVGITSEAEFLAATEQFNQAI